MRIGRYKFNQLIEKHKYQYWKHLLQKPRIKINKYSPSKKKKEIDIGIHK